MSTIEQRDERERKFFEFVELLVKISQCNKSCRVELNYDGAKFASWNVHASNLTAADWNPAEAANRLPSDITVDTARKLLRR
jgi:hypothetical protein